MIEVGGGGRPVMDAALGAWVWSGAGVKLCGQVAPGAEIGSNGDLHEIAGGALGWLARFYVC